MHLLNYYFIPFATLLVGTAIWKAPDSVATPGVRVAAGLVLVAAIAVNWWFANRSYRYMMWMRHLREAQVWMNTLWALPLYWMFCGVWGPMWLLFTFSPVTAAQHMDSKRTLLVSVVNALLMCAILWARGVAFYEDGQFVNTQIWMMTLVHASFVVCIGMFVRALSEVALKLRSGGA